VTAEEDSAEVSAMKKAGAIPLCVTESVTHCGDGWQTKSGINPYRSSR
jgi:hypothetical protein